MAPLGFSIDNLSLLALTLSIGFVVDDAIVMLENIVRHMEMGKSSLQAALDGSSEIGFTIVSMTVSLAAVFIPVLFMPGIVGRLFHEFAIAICVAIVLSGIVSLTLTPMLCSRYLRPSAQAGHGRLYAATERAFGVLLRHYERSLRWVLTHRPATMGVSLLILVATGYLFVHVPKGFIPNEDLSAVFAMTEGSQGASFTAMVENQKAVTNLVRTDATVESMFSTVIGSNAASGSTSNQGRMFIRLAPRSERPRIGAVVERLRPLVREHPRPARLFAGAAGDPHRRPADEELVSIDVAEPQHRRTLHRRAAARSAAAHHPAAAGRHQRRAVADPGAVAADRP